MTYVTGFAETKCVLMIFGEIMQIKMFLTENHLKISETTAKLNKILL